METAIMYSLPNCTQCIALSRILDQKGIKYEKNQDMDTMLALGIRGVPMMKFPGEDKLLTFKETLDHIRK